MSVHKTKQSECTSKIIIQSGVYEVEILEECADSQRNVREQYWIDNFDCVNIKNPVRKKYWEKVPENKIKIKEWKKNDKKYKDSWGGDKRHNNNLLSISLDIFS